MGSESLRMEHVIPKDVAEITKNMMSHVDAV